jgi:hypothetical protein
MVVLTLSFGRSQEKWPTFNCSHNHCAGRKLDDVIDWAAALRPGIIDEHCGQTWRSDGLNGHRPVRVLPQQKPTIPTPEEAIRNTEEFLDGFRVDQSSLWESSSIALGEDWRRDAVLLLEHLYAPDELLCVCVRYTELKKLDGTSKAVPVGPGATMRVRELRNEIQRRGAVPQDKAGCWCRINPVSQRGSGTNGAHCDNDVQDYRFLLVESDDLPPDLQLSFFLKLELPVVALISSGGRSIHCIVKLDAPSAEEFKRLADHILGRLARFGIDQKNRNPSRYSRLPGAQRVIGAQTLLGEDSGQQRLLYFNHQPKPFDRKAFDRQTEEKSTEPVPSEQTPRNEPSSDNSSGEISPETPLSKRLKVEKAQANLPEERAGQSTIEPSKSENSKKSQLILPSGDVSIIEGATLLFEQLAKTHRYFARGRLVVEVVCNKEGNEVLSPLRGNAFRSRMEKDFKLQVWRSLRGEQVLKSAHCPKDIAEAFLESDPAIDCLPGIALLVSSPILAERDGELVALNKGYHDVNGGIYVEKRVDIVEVQLKEATESLLGLLADFDFTTGSDKSRAIASFISPALRFGCLLNADFPLDLAEADDSQSGKTYRQKVACAIYGEKPYVIARRENGVGSLDESISCALLSGRPFICFENVRGVMDSQILESAIRGHGHVNVRVPHRGEVQLSTERVCWQLSSNQAATTRDLANRSVVTRIRKRQSGYQYQTFSEGDLLTHVQRNCGHYLSCVLSVIQAWFREGRPKTADPSHDFREWSQSLDWIVQNLFALPPLLDGHREDQQRISDPHLNWLRDVALAVSQAGKLEEALRPGELVDLAASRGVAVPGHGRHTDESQQTMLAGRILNKIFSDNNSVHVGGFQVRHDPRTEHDYKERRDLIRHYYWSEILPEKCAPCASCASS